MDIAHKASIGSFQALSKTLNGITASAATSAVAPALVSLPPTSVVAAQPYATLSGYGLSINFAPRPSSSTTVQRSTSGIIDGLQSSAPRSLTALHSLPFSHALVPSAYQHVAFEALMEFCTSERPDSKLVPMANVWDRVGDIGTCYASVGYGQSQQRIGSESPLSRRLRVLKERAGEKGRREKGMHQGSFRGPEEHDPSHVPSSHPTIAGIELVSSNKGALSSSNALSKAPKKLLDIKVSLYDRNHQAIYTALMTGGPEAGTLRDSVVEEIFLADDATTKAGSLSLRGDCRDLMRPDADRASGSGGQVGGLDQSTSGWFIKNSLAFRFGRQLSEMAELFSFPLSQFTANADSLFSSGAIFGLRHGPSAASGEAPRKQVLLSQLAFVPTGALAAAPQPVENQDFSVPMEGPVQSQRVPIPPWFLTSMMTEFAESLVGAQQGRLGEFLLEKRRAQSSTIPIDSPVILRAGDAMASLLFSADTVSRVAGIQGEEKAPLLRSSLSLISHNSTLTSDVFTGEAIEFIASQPLFYPSYHVAPWQHSLGLPHLRGEECISFYAEVWQGGERKMRGTFFFTSL